MVNLNKLNRIKTRVVNPKIKTKYQVKGFKIVTICIIAIFVIFFAFYKSDKINIEGNWEAKKIVLNGKQLYPTEIDSFFEISPEIIISNWTHSISIPTKGQDINAGFVVEKNSSGKYQVKLSSR